MGRTRQPNGAQAIERIFEAWDAALGAKDSRRRWGARACGRS